jgi:hypothetical protein
MGRHSTKIWTLADLAQRFPQVTLPSGEPMGTCAGRLVGSGRYIRETPVGAEFGHVAVEATPAPTFGLRCAHRWPDLVPDTDVEQLDAALLEGLFETVGRLEAPLRTCLVSSTFVEHRADVTTPRAVRIAAAMALADLVRKASWHPEGPSAA